MLTQAVVGGAKLIYKAMSSDSKKQKSYSSQTSYPPSYASSSAASSYTPAYTSPYASTNTPSYLQHQISALFAKFPKASDEEQVEIFEQLANKLYTEEHTDQSAQLAEYLQSSPLMHNFIYILTYNKLVIGTVPKWAAPIIHVYLQELRCSISHDQLYAIVEVFKDCKKEDITSNSWLAALFTILLRIPKTKAWLISYKPLIRIFHPCVVGLGYLTLRAYIKRWIRNRELRELGFTAAATASDGCESDWLLKLMSDTELVEDSLATPDLLEHPRAWEFIGNLALHPEAKKLLPAMKIVECAHNGKTWHCLTTIALLSEEQEATSLVLTKEYLAETENRLNCLIEGRPREEEVRTHLLVLIAPLVNLSMSHANRGLMGRIISALLKVVLLSDSHEARTKIGSSNFKRAKCEAVMVLSNLAFLEENRALIDKEDGLTKLSSVYDTTDDSTMKANITGVSCLFTERIVTNLMAKFPSADEHEQVRLLSLATTSLQIPTVTPKFVKFLEASATLEYFIQLFTYNRVVLGTIPDWSIQFLAVYLYKFDCYVSKAQTIAMFNVFVQKHIYSANQQLREASALVVSLLLVNGAGKEWLSSEDLIFRKNLVKSKDTSMQASGLSIFGSASDGVHLKWLSKILNDKELIDTILALPDILTNKSAWILFANVALHPDAKIMLPKKVLELARSGNLRHCYSTYTLLCGEVEAADLHVNEEYLTEHVGELATVLDKYYKRTKHMGANLLDLVIPIVNLSRIDIYKGILGRLAISLLLQVVDLDETNVQLLKLSTECIKRAKNEAASALWHLAYSEENRIVLSGSIDRLQKVLESSDNRELKDSIEGILCMILQSNSTNPKAPADKGFIMISYNWANQPAILRLAAALKERGYSIWLDVERMKGNTFSAMSSAVEGADVVLMCYCQKYKDSPNCRREGEYCAIRKVDFIPLLMQDRYMADGWLGLVLGSKLYHDFSSEKDWDRRFSQLVNELGDRGKKKRPVPILKKEAESHTAKPLTSNSNPIASSPSPARSMKPRATTTRLSDAELEASSTRTVSTPRPTPSSTPTPTPIPIPTQSVLTMRKQLRELPATTDKPSIPTEPPFAPKLKPTPPSIPAFKLAQAKFQSAEPTAKPTAVASLKTNQPAPDAARPPPIPLRKAPPPIPPRTLLLKALYDFEAIRPDELTFKAGDTITFTKKLDAEWWVGELNGKSGAFPANYVESMA